MGLVLMYSIKDSVTSTEICPRKERKTLSKFMSFVSLFGCVCDLGLHFEHGKIPEELLCQCSSKAQWKMPRRGGARNCGNKRCVRFLSFLRNNVAFSFRFYFHVDSLELAEDVGVFRCDATGLKHCNSESEDAPHLQLAF